LAPESPDAARRAQESVLPQSKRKKWSSDAELVQHILDGSREHFEMLYEAYFHRVYRFALKRLGDPLLIWIFGITRNTVNRRFRRVRPRLESLDSGSVSEVPGAEAPTDQAVDARRMLRLCEAVIENDLTPLQRRIFHLKHLRRQSIRSIAQALGKSEDAIKANLYRMRRAIAQSAPGLESFITAR
jgi:DNA-directed RNA polymerase specialized sigma24 family protein